VVASQTTQTTAPEIAERRIAMRATVLCLLGLAACLNAGCAAAQESAGSWAMKEFSANGGVPDSLLRHESPAPASPSADASPTPMVDASSEAPRLTVLEPRKVIYTGQFNVVVAEVDASTKAVKALADKLGGYTLRMTINSIAIRVPSEKFDAAVEEIGRLGTVIDKEITAQDVTEKVLDLQLRLKNAKVAQAKLLSLLDKAQAVADTLEIEKEVLRLTTEIEQLEGQINKISHEVAYATLTITFTRTQNAPAATRVKLPFRWLTGLGLETLLEF
jgi:hypothetical protein